MTKQTWTMARDQYGDTWHDLGPHPRRELLKRLGRSSAAKMYIDTKAGETKHIGYIIAGRWLTIYTVTEWTGRAVRMNIHQLIRENSGPESEPRPI